ncbi:MAG: hypothetical protein ACT4QG_11650 [Sporichthyaceae bacterium]
MKAAWAMGAVAVSATLIGTAPTGTAQAASLPAAAGLLRVCADEGSARVRVTPGAGLAAGSAAFRVAEGTCTTLRLPGPGQYRVVAEQPEFDCYGPGMPGHPGNFPFCSGDGRVYATRLVQPLTDGGSSRNTFVGCPDIDANVLPGAITEITYVFGNSSI